MWQDYDYKEGVDELDKKPVDKKVKKLGKRVHDGEFKSQDTVARVSKTTHKNLHLIKLLGEFNSLDEVITLMVKDLTIRVGPKIEDIAKELKKLSE